MQEDFNPYLEWLGRPDGQPPANYYELLGLRCYEDNPTIILQTADARIAQLRAIAPGARAALWQQIMDQLNWAKVCLLDPRAKAGYDMALRGQQMAAPSAPSAPPMVVDQPTEAPLDQSALAGIPYQHPSHRRKKSRKPQLIGWFLTLVALASIAAFVAMLLKERQQTEERAIALAETDMSDAPLFGKASHPKPGDAPAAGAAAKNTKQPPNAKRPDVEPAKDSSTDEPMPGLPDLSTALVTGGSTGKKSDAAEKTDSADEKSSKDGSAAAKKTQEADKPEPPADPAKQAVMEQELSKAREAMAERKLTVARQHVKTALANAQLKADRARCERTQLLLDFLTRFWKEMRDILTRLQPGDEVPLGDTPVIVVSADAREVTFRTEARNQTYAIDRLPNSIIMALVRERFAKNRDANVLLGAYLSVDSEGDPAMACRLWQEVTKDGADMTDMIADLTAATSLLADGTRPEAPSDQAKLQQAEQAMKTKLRAEFEEATSAAKKLELANALIERSRAVKGNPELRFVMLREAADQAAAAGKAAVACAAVDQLARYFTFDEVAMKAAAMEQAAKKAHGTQACRETAEQILKVMEQAVAKGQAADAKRLATIAVALAKKSANGPLMRRVQMVVQQVGTSSGSARKTAEE